MSQPLLIMALVMAAMQLLAWAPLASANWLEVPVHHGGGGGGHARLGGQREQKSYHHRARDVARQSYGQEEESGTSSDLLTYILPALAITGLSLLFPSIVTINGAGRRRRDVDQPEPAARPVDELLEHLSNIYYAATESEECIQRIVCELGATAKSFKKGNKDIMISLLGKAASNKYSNLFGKFREGANSANCKKLGCKLME